MPCGVRSNTKQLVILSAKRERIRISPLKGKRIAAGLKPLAMTRRGGETDCRTPYGGLACRLGRCFCFAEVSGGHPHRNDRKDGFPRTVYYRKKQIFKALAFFFCAFLPFALRQCLLRHIPRLTQLRGLK